MIVKPTPESINILLFSLFVTLVYRFLTPSIADNDIQVNT